jgi:hypothetical protein
MVKFFPLYGAGTARQDYLQDINSLQVLVRSAHSTFAGTQRPSYIF